MLMRFLLRSLQEPIHWCRELLSGIAFRRPSDAYEYDIFA
jgi:hypothetical protein